MLPKRVFATSLLLAMPLAYADTLLLDGIEAARDTGHMRPSRGLSMEAVRTAFGAPSVQRDAVGAYAACRETRFCPPITRWDYPSFVVYFEHDRVIHAVPIRSAPPELT